MLAPVRFVAVIAAVIAAMAWPGLASADVEADCRSDQAARVVQACSELMRTTGRSAADRIGFLDRRSRAHVELNAIGAAEADVAEIFKLDANSPVAFYARGRIRQARSETAAALADYNESHLRAADKYEPLIERGRFYLRMSEFDKARADFDAALQLNATKAAPYVGRALAQSGKGDTSAAMRDFEQAWRVEPGNIVTYLERGEVRLKVGAARDAQADFERVLRQVPGHPRATRGRTEAMAGSSRSGTVATTRSAPRPSTTPAPAGEAAPSAIPPSPMPAAAPPVTASRSIEPKRPAARAVTLESRFTAAMRVRQRPDGRKPTARMPAIPVVIVRKITGAIIIFTKLMKASPKGFNSTPRSGQIKPTAIPAKIASKTCA